MKIRTTDYQVLTHFLGAIFNGDFTALDASEIVELDVFEDAAGDYARTFPGYKSHHWSDTGETESYGRCEVTQCFGGLAKIQLVVLVD